MGFREQIDNISGLTPLNVFCGGNFTDTEIANGIKEKFNVDVVIMNIDVDSVRQVIRSCYETCVPVVYFFPNVQNMSLNAINALLKITEEPPNNSRFVLTVNRLDNLISTIRSRAMIITLKSEGIKYDSDLTAFCEKVYFNIKTVPFINALKISTYMKLKDTDIDKYDLLSFFNCMLNIYLDKIKNYTKTMTTETKELVEHEVQHIMITNNTIKELECRGVKKESVFDSWIIKIRGVGTNEEKYTRNSLRVTE